MKTSRIVLGVTLLVIGLAGGLYIGFYLFTIGIAAIKQKDTVRGLLYILLWAELAGGAFTLAFLIPGILLLRSLDEDKYVDYAREAKPQQTTDNDPS